MKNINNIEELTINQEKKIIVTSDLILNIKNVKTLDLEIKDQVQVYLFLDNNKMDFKLKIKAYANCLIYLYIEECNYNVSNDIYFYDNVEVKFYQTVISKDVSTHQVKTYHVGEKTNGIISLKGLSLADSYLTFINETTLDNKNKESEVKQLNQIINQDNGQGKIVPCLYINSDQVIGNHSAYIGDFKTEDLFYLQTRGLTKDDAYNLLLKGYLLPVFEMNILAKDKVLKLIEKYKR